MSRIGRANYILRYLKKDSNPFKGENWKKLMHEQKEAEAKNNIYPEKRLDVVQPSVEDQSQHN